MKNKKCTILISALIAIAGIVGFAILQFRLYVLIGIYGGTQFLSDLRQFAMVITSGLFTSAMVTLLISVSEYRNERVDALENMYLAAMDLEREFSKIKYFLPDEPKELIQNVLGELDNNDWESKYNENLATSVLNFEDQQKADDAYEKYHMELKHDAQKAFRDYVWEHCDEREKAAMTEPFQIKDFLDRTCAEKIEKYDEQLKETMKSFLRFQEVQTSAITAAYGKMDFIFANKSIRINVYNKLYRKLFDTVNLIKNSNYHFDLFFSGKGGTRAVQCEFVWKLQDKLLSEDEDHYYRQFDFDITTEMVQVLVYANGKVNKDEFPELKGYMLCTKPGYFQKMQKEWEEKNGANN